MSQARLTIVTDDHKTVKLLVTDPSKLSIAGKGDLTFSCGVQKPRRVMVGYTPKVNRAPGDIGRSGHPRVQVIALTRISHTLS